MTNARSSARTRASRSWGHSGNHAASCSRGGRRAGGVGAVLLRRRLGFVDADTAASIREAAGLMRSLLAASPRRVRSNSFCAAFRSSRSSGKYGKYSWRCVEASSDGMLMARSFRAPGSCRNKPAPVLSIGRRQSSHKGVLMATVVVGGGRGHLQDPRASGRGAGAPLCFAPLRASPLYALRAPALYGGRRCACSRKPRRRCTADCPEDAPKPCSPRRLV